jgi:pSer/pThr/pTyr-binding forkhead associated (FHA) protein
MPSGHAELIFVSGPQQGQREALLKTPILVGRDPNADICIEEEVVSRQHVRLDRTADGWVLTNLSRNGTDVNGKRYKKASKQILLDTGDVVTIGALTAALFVGTGDDSEQPLQAYRLAHSPDEPREQAAAGQADLIQEQEQEQETETAEPEAPRPARSKEPEESGPTASEEENAGSKRFKRFAIGLGIYFAAMLGLFAFLAMRDSGDKDPDQQAIARLSEDQIQRILIDKTYQRQRDPVLAREMLTEAEQYYRRRNDEPGNLYRAVKAYKLHMAYRNVAGFEQFIHQSHYNEALEQLQSEILSLYNEAYVKTRRGRWAEAQRAWEQLQEELPVKQGTEPDLENKLWEHIKQQLLYVSDQRKQAEGKPGSDRPGL